MAVFADLRDCPWGLPVVEKEDGSLEHVYCDDSREHVLSYSSAGTHCSEPRCEVNRRLSARETRER